MNGKIDLWTWVAPILMRIGAEDGDDDGAGPPHGAYPTPASPWGA